MRVGPAQPRRVWSLLNLINFSLDELLQAMRWLNIYRDAAFSEAADANAILSPETALNVERALQVCTTPLQRLELQAPLDRISRIEAGLNASPLLAYDMGSELKVLIEIIEDSARHELFYRYTRDGAARIANFDHEWADVIRAFPSCEIDARDGVDCYGTEHYTAAVFHFMRVSERGLWALAHERQVQMPKNKPLEWAQWQEILTKINDSLDPLKKGTAAGPRKDEALAFYAGLFLDIEGFKDLYRNNVMHGREHYKEVHSVSAMNHVHRFMSRLSGKISERTRKPIKWRL